MLFESPSLKWCPAVTIEQSNCAQHWKFVDGQHDVVRQAVQQQVVVAIANFTDSSNLLNGAENVGPYDFAARVRRLGFSGLGFSAALMMLYVRLVFIQCCALLP